VESRNTDVHRRSSDAFNLFAPAGRCAPIASTSTGAPSHAEPRPQRSRSAPRPGAFAGARSRADTSAGAGADPFSRAFALTSDVQTTRAMRLIVPWKSLHGRCRSDKAATTELSLDSWELRRAVATFIEKRRPLANAPLTENPGSGIPTSGADRRLSNGRS
jgi:hypothetical protein